MNLFNDLIKEKIKDFIIKELKLIGFDRIINDSLVADVEHSFNDGITIYKICKINFIDDDIIIDLRTESKTLDINDYITDKVKCIKDICDYISDVFNKLHENSIAAEDPNHIEILNIINECFFNFNKRDNAFKNNDILLKFEQKEGYYDFKMIKDKLELTFKITDINSLKDIILEKKKQLCNGII